jgi:hypothetical protein
MLLRHAVENVEHAPGHQPEAPHQVGQVLVFSHDRPGAIARAVVEEDEFVVLSGISGAKPFFVIGRRTFRRRRRRIWASSHLRGGHFHSSAALFKTKYSSLIAPQQIVLG